MRRGNRGHQFAVQNVYARASEEQRIAISVRNDNDWAALLSIVAEKDLGLDERWATEAGRWAHQDVVDARLTEFLGAAPIEPILRALLAAGVPAAPVVLPTVIGDNPQLCSRTFFETVRHRLCGPIRHPRPPITARPGAAGSSSVPPPCWGRTTAKCWAAVWDSAPRSFVCSKTST